MPAAACSRVVRITNTLCRLNENAHESNMLIHMEDPPIGALDKHLTDNELLDAKDNTILHTQANGSAAMDCDEIAHSKPLLQTAYPLFSTALAAYSTWKTRPSGE
jgi:hypothetical protein